MDDIRHDLRELLEDLPRARATIGGMLTVFDDEPRYQFRQRVNSVGFELLYLTRTQQQAASEVLEDADVEGHQV